MTRAAMATPGQAIQALTTIALRGRRRPTARRWMRGTATQPGAIFVYAALVPGVCLVMRERAVITVFSRPSCRAWRASHGSSAERRVTRGENLLRQDELVDVDEAA